MKTKQIFAYFCFGLFVLLYTIPIKTFSQNTYDRQEKYWYLRDRLRYFIGRNSDPMSEYGSNLVTVIRNRNEHNGDGFDRFADFGQESSIFGKYIGVLATEYYLLNAYGNTQEAAKTDQELMEALMAQMRRDYCEHNWLPPNNTDVLNGFFIRQDVPGDNLLTSDNTFLLNHPELNKYAGLLISEDPLIDPAASPTDVIKVNMVGSYTPAVEAMSQDEAIFTLEGLALAYHFGSPTVQPIAQAYALWILQCCYGYWPYFGLWQIIDPTWNIPTGGDCSFFSQGFSYVEAYFNGPFYPPTPYSFYPYWPFDCFNGYGGSGTNHMVASLAAIGNGFGSHTQEGIYNNCDGMNNWKEYYLWLHEALQDYHHDYIDVGNVEDRLDEAPCEGPWRHNKASCACNGWASPDRWYHTIGEQTGSTGDVGIFSGIDYMILLNLYYICNVVGCSSCGVDYRNMDDAILDSQWPQGNKGSTTDPLIISTFRSITSTEHILSTPLLGDVNYFAGKTITLKPGFYAEQSANFIAQIQDLAYCPNGPYKKDSILNIDTLRHREDVSNQNEINFTKKTTIDPSNSISNITNKGLGCYILYPNPTDGILYIKSSDCDSFSFVLQEINGTVILEQSFILGDNNQIDLNFLIPGVYIAKIITQNYSITKKIVKK